LILQHYAQRSAYQSLMQPAPQQDQATGKVQYPAAIGYVSTNDTGLLSQYLNYDL
jgi:hypothetical protein